MSQTPNASQLSAPVLRSPLPSDSSSIDACHAPCSIQLVPFTPSLAATIRGPCRSTTRKCLFSIKFEPESSDSEKFQFLVFSFFFSFSLPPLLSYPWCPFFQPFLVLIDLQVLLGFLFSLLSSQFLSVSLIISLPFLSKDMSEEQNSLRRLPNLHSDF